MFGGWMLCEHPAGQTHQHWLMSQATVNGVTSDWGPVTGGALQGSILSPVLFNIFINGLDAGLEEILSKSADNTKLGGAVDSLEIKEALQRDVDKLGDLVITNQLKFSKEKCQILHIPDKVLPSDDGLMQRIYGQAATFP
ncbi:hypothetical protein HGM15179_016954 [Zosterops borbonicus]|uniref:Reverse transcriptase domain-containing protein n=1 Tax=Zosterops borbonicus TaxID=364589 RepID=A0A8K1G1U5_9PASS|nr:hypothetical protein HGM15179_016954 [Zosterops borbonicus]